MVGNTQNIVISLLFFLLDCLFSLLLGALLEHQVLSTGCSFQHHTSQTHKKYRRAQRSALERVFVKITASNSDTERIKT